MPQLTVNFIDECSKKHTIPTDIITKVLNCAYSLKGENIPAMVNLMITTDDNIAVMNEQYLDHQGPTDVLAFEDGEEEDGVILLGDIAVSADTASSLSESKNMSFEEELTLYCLHGLFHLLGMRDKTDELRQEMIDAQAEIFSANNLNYTP